MTLTARAEKLAETIAIDTDVILDSDGLSEEVWASYQHELARMIAAELAAAVLEEREACAKVAQKFTGWSWGDSYPDHCCNIANEIRARSEGGKEGG